MRPLFVLGLLGGWLAACVPTPTPVIPTAAEIEPLMTAQWLTQNAPPPGFDREVGFPAIDANLERLPGWQAFVEVTFVGQFMDNDAPADGSLSAEIYVNALGAARRVVIRGEGAALGMSSGIQREAVRISNDYYLVGGTGECDTDPDSGAQALAQISPSSLVGGVRRARPTSLHQTINGLEAWQYTFESADVSLPPDTLSQTGSRSATGELWIAPELGVVTRYTATLDVRDVTLLDGDHQVLGRLNLRYDLLNAGAQPNIAVPFGC